jgi:hypothetical protein
VIMVGVLLWPWPPVKLFRQQEWGLFPGFQHRVFSPVSCRAKCLTPGLIGVQHPVINKGGKY